MKLKMARIQIVGLKSKLGQIIEVLQTLGCIQIDNLTEAAGHSLKPLKMSEATLQLQADLTHLLTRIESLLATFTPDKTDHAPQTSASTPLQPVREIRNQLETISKQAQRVTKQRDQLQAELASYPRYQATLQKLLPLVPESAQDPHTASIVVLVPQAHRWASEMIATRVQEMTHGQAELVEANLGDLQAMLLVIPREYAPELEQLLGAEDIARMRLPDEFEGQSPPAAAASLNRRLQEIPAELEQLEDETAALSQEWEPLLSQWRRQLQDQLDRIEIQNHFVETAYTFVLEGWIPEEDIPAVTEHLTAADSSAHITIQPLSDQEAAAAPVALANPPLARPFESLVRIFSVPTYRGLDPTLLMAIFLPIFFGMILGDIGYGAILLLLCGYGLWRIRSAGMLRDLLYVLTAGSLWGIIFGILYGEAFGTLGEELGLHALWLERAAPEQVTALLIFTIGVGAVHTLLGLLLGTWEAWRGRNRHHLLERGGMLLGLIGLFGLVGVLVQQLPADLMTPAIGLMILGIVLLSSAGGWLGILLGPIEFIGLIGNVLSYLRIAAVGLASVYVALVANELAGSLGNLIVGVLVAILIHALNIALGAFSPTIHSLRLHYVEFFRKFYEGGGRPFTPFRSQFE